MINDTTLYIGVDPSGGRKPFSYAALDQNGKLVALSAGELEDVLEFITAPQRDGVILAVNAASSLSKGLIRNAEIRKTLPALRISGRSLDMRLAEHILRQRGINVSMTPSQKELCSSWVQTGFEFYRQLETLGFQAHPGQNSPFLWLETHPHVCFTTMLGQNPLSRSVLEGRLQRQLVLYEAGLGIRDPMEFFEEITRHKLLLGKLPMEKL